MIKKFKNSLVIGLFASLLNTLPIKAAEKILLTYGSLKLSLPVSSLSNYAKDGTIDSELDPYLNMISTDEKAQFRSLLTNKLALDPVVTSRFLNSDIGEEILVNMGKAVMIEGGINGKYAIRAAIVQSSFQTGGFTLLGFLEKFPTNMEFSGEYLLGLYNQKSLIDQASKIIEEKFKEFFLSTGQKMQKRVAKITGKGFDRKLQHIQQNP